MGGYSSGNPIINITPPTPTPGTATVLSIFNEITNVAVNSTETIISYTVPPATTNYLVQIDVGGENIATYDILLNGSMFGRLRTYFGEGMTASLIVANDGIDGYKLVAGDNLVIQVTNFRPCPATFEARLQITR